MMICILLNIDLSPYQEILTYALEDIIIRSEGSLDHNLVECHRVLLSSTIYSNL